VDNWKVLVFMFLAWVIISAGLIFCLESYVKENG